MNSFTPYQKFLFAALLIVWVLLAINPADRTNWLLENLLVAIFVPVVIVTGRYFRLSSLSYTLITVFMILHLVGAHYNYSEVPFGYTVSKFFGADRNHYDRIVHFSYGLLLSYPVREMFLRIASVRGFWGFFLPLDVTLAMSAVYEIIEWSVAALFDPEAGPAFLGSQGDVWDAQKDMGLAGLGAFLTMSAAALINWWYDKNFLREMVDSFRVKSHRPLGEDRLDQLIRGQWEEKAE